MRPRRAGRALIAGLLTGGLIVSGATSALARPETSRHQGGTTLSVRLAPPVVTVGDPAAVVAQLTPAQAGRPVTVQEPDGTELATGVLDAKGRSVITLDTSAAGTVALQVVADAWNGKAAVYSSRVSLKVLDPTYCIPKVALVDKQANADARCLANRLDRWKSAGLMGVGQQVNVSSCGFTGPLAALAPQRVNVIGFDLWELAQTAEYEFPCLEQVVTDLTALADSGAVLSVSWHASNPHTGGNYADRGWHDLGALLDPSTAEYASFWTDYQDELELLRLFQDNGVALVFRPLHEANGDWFWWGNASRSTYRKVWAEMQRRAGVAGIHNLIWAYSFAAKTRSGIADPASLIPARVDLAGLDSYDPEGTSADAKDHLDVTGYAAVGKLVRRMAFTEVGPAHSADGSWNPSIISRTARAQTSKPLWSMLWFDDSEGRKQISSLAGGPAWLNSCPNGYCVVG